MNTDFYVTTEAMAEPALGCTAELERLGDEIAVLSAHLDAATAHLLDLIREFDAREPLQIVDQYTFLKKCVPRHDRSSWRRRGRSKIEV